MDDVLVNKVLASTIAVVIVNRGPWHIDGQLFKVGATMTIELGIEIGEQSSLEKRIFGKINTSDNMTRLELVRL